MENTQIIDKSIIHGFPFVKEDVLVNKIDQKERFRRLELAVQLGNLYKQHVRLKFKHQNMEQYATIATVWATTEKYVVLKGNAVIPVHSIYEVEFS